MDEYKLVCETFSHIKFYDFSTNYFVSRPRIAISINGSINQKPDREYYVVFESSTDYMIQVYKINPETKRREGMLFTVFVKLKDGEYHYSSST
jgi:hypothetical protein